MRKVNEMLFVVILAVIFLGVFVFFTLTPEPVVLPPAPETLELTSIITGQPEAILADNLQLDEDSQSGSYGCFQTDMSLPMLTETYQLYEAANPATPTDPMACYDSAEIVADLNADKALAFLSRAGIGDGLDRVIVIYGDGRGFVWTQPNEQE
ncbi:MAG: histidine kinase [Rhodobacterales bacterium]|nr:MAG: histidine kinase [Rhodobacterales bacterium]